MTEKPTTEQDAWVQRYLLIDPGNPAELSASRRSAPVRAAKNAGNSLGDAFSTAKIGAEALEQTARGALSSAGEKSMRAVAQARKVVGWGAAQTAPPMGPVALTSQTEFLHPADRARTKLGVGERVILTVTGGSGNWTASGGKISAKTGTTVTMTAPQRPGNVTVTVNVGAGNKRSLDFTVIAPSEVHMVTARDFMKTTRSQMQGWTAKYISDLTMSTLEPQQTRKMTSAQKQLGTGKISMGAVISQAANPTRATPMW